MNDSIQKLVIGTAQFGMRYGISNQRGELSIGGIKAVLELAKKNGINRIDTAINYGRSESKLGKAGVDAYKIISKLPPLPPDINCVGKWIEDCLKNSLDRLRIKQLEGLLLHKPTDLLGDFAQDLYRGLQYCKEKQLVRKIGVSIYDPSELSIIISSYPVDIVQVPFNLVDQRIKSSGWLYRLKNDGVEIHARSIFLQGLLLMSREQRPKVFNRWNGLWNKWDQWLSEHQMTRLKSCLNFVCNHKQIDRVIVGVDSTEQLREIIKNAKMSCHFSPPTIICDDIDLINPSRW